MSESQYYMSLNGRRIITPEIFDTLHLVNINSTEENYNYQQNDLKNYFDDELSFENFTKMYVDEDFWNFLIMNAGFENMHYYRYYFQNTHKNILRCFRGYRSQ